MISNIDINQIVVSNKFPFGKHSKRQKKFDKYITIWENVCNIIKKINIELVYNKKYLKAEKTFNTNFHCFYIPVILFDSVSRKDGNYYSQHFLEKSKKFWFLGLWQFLLKYKKVPFPEI